MMPKLFFLMSFVLGSSMASMPGDVWQLEINGPIGLRPPCVPALTYSTISNN